ncbi:hypothetical protein [Dyadobacter luteus]|nr:hypothetical protein [Dyadobacter luteus]
MKGLLRKHYLAKALLPLFLLSLSFTGSAQDPSTFLLQPRKIAVDSKDNVYVLHQGGITKIAPDGKMTLVSDIFFGDIVIDSKDQLYFSGGSSIWKMNQATGVIEFYSGDKNYGGGADGKLLEAKFNKIQSLYIDQNDVIYAADAALFFLKEIDPKAGKTWIEPNVPGRYRKIENWYCIRKISQGNVSTLKTSDGKLLLLNNVTGIAVDRDGNVIHAGGGYSRAVRKLNMADFTWSTLGGKPYKREWCPVYVPGDTAKAELFDPGPLLLDNKGAVVYLDNRSHRISKIADGKVITLAGSGLIDPCGQNIGGRAREGYKDGKSTLALFNFPKGMAYDSKGNLLIADTNNSCVRKLSADGIVTTITYFDRSKALINNY